MIVYECPKCGDRRDYDDVPANQHPLRCEKCDVPMLRHFGMKAETGKLFSEFPKS